VSQDGSYCLWDDFLKLQEFRLHIVERDSVVESQLTLPILEPNRGPRPGARKLFLAPTRAASPKKIPRLTQYLRVARSGHPRVPYSPAIPDGFRNQFKTLLLVHFEPMVGKKTTRCLHSGGFSEVWFRLGSNDGPQNRRFSVLSGADSTVLK
jgi:hypothetical protein